MQQRRSSECHQVALVEVVVCVCQALSFVRWRVQDWSVDRRGIKLGGGRHRESIKLLSGFPGMYRHLALSRLRVIRRQEPVATKCVESRVPYRLGHRYAGRVASRGGGCAVSRFFPFFRSYVLRTAERVVVSRKGGLE